MSASPLHSNTCIECLFNRTADRMQRNASTFSTGDAFMSRERPVPKHPLPILGQRKLCVVTLGLASDQLAPFPPWSPLFYSSLMCNLFCVVKAIVGTGHRHVALCYHWHASLGLSMQVSRVKFSHVLCDAGLNISYTSQFKWNEALFMMSSTVRELLNIMIHCKMWYSSTYVIGKISEVVVITLWNY